MRLSTRLALLAALPFLAACDGGDPAPPEGALTFALTGPATVRAGTRSVNDEVAVALRVTNGADRAVTLQQACGAPVWTLEKEAGSAWTAVASAPCADAPAARPLAVGDTLTLRLRLTLTDFASAAGATLPGRYRVRLDARWPDGTALDAAARTSAPFDVADAVTTPAPVLFAPGVVASADEEWRITFTPDGATAYFARSDDFFPFSRQATIYETRLVDGAWTAPAVAPFSGTYPDIDPFVSPDGSRLFFSSIRPVDGQPREDLDLWVVERAGAGWGAPRHLGAVNSATDELYASVDAAGTLYVASDRTGSWDVYHAEPTGTTYGAAASVGAPVNTAAWDFNPVVSPDGNTLVFTGLNYPGGAGLGDLYVSRRSGGAWSTPASVGAAVNTAADEFHPAFAPDGRHLFFIRRAGQGDPHVVSWPVP
jgi:hypothetical protein